MGRGGRKRKGEKDRERGERVRLGYLSRVPRVSRYATAEGAHKVHLTAAAAADQSAT